MSTYEMPVKVTSCPECDNEGRKVYDQQIENEQYWCTECGEQYKPRLRELREWVNEHNE